MNGIVRARRSIAPALALACVLVALAGAWLPDALAADAAGRVAKPAISVDRSTQCIDTPEVMRRTHMDMLKHQRDRTVRAGVRGEKVHLNGCVECHAGPGTGPAAGSVIGSPQAFCEGCHRYAAVKLDCFECHQSRPASAPAAGAATVPGSGASAGAASAAAALIGSGAVR
jgi:hypothetical protein